MHNLVLFTDALAASACSVYSHYTTIGPAARAAKRHSAGCSQGNALLSGTCAARSSPTR